MCLDRQILLSIGGLLSRSPPLSYFTKGSYNLLKINMARITLRQLLDHAAEGSYGVPAFNISNIEQLMAIMRAAREVDAPVILQASRGSSKLF